VQIGENNLLAGLAKTSAWPFLIIKTNFNGTVQEVHEFTNAEIDRPENFRVLRAL
jgi:hypothetical protein